MTDAKKDRGAYTALCSLGNTLRQLGRNVSDEMLLQAHPELKDRELTWEALGKAARAYDFKPILLHPTADELREVPVPAVVRFKSGAFAMLGVNTDESVFFLDPTRDHPVAMPTATFHQVWSGEVLVLKPKLTWAEFRRR